MIAFEDDSTNCNCNCNYKYRDLSTQLRLAQDDGVNWVGEFAGCGAWVE